MKGQILFTRGISFILIFALLLPLSYVLVSATQLPQNSKIDFKLLEILEESSNNVLIPVSVWFADISKEHFDNQTKRAASSLVVNQSVTPSFKQITDTYSTNTITDNKLSLNEINELVSTRRNVAKLIYSEYNGEQLNSMTTEFSDYEVEYICSYAPNVVLKLVKSDIYKLISNKNVVSVYYYEENICASTDDSIGEFSSSTEMSYIDFSECLKAIESRSDLTGEGIKIGLIENGVPATGGSLIHRELANGEDNIIFDPDILTPHTFYTGHADVIATLLVGKSDNEEDSFVGIVPDAQLYCTSTKVPDGWKAGIEWLIDSQVAIINISVSISDDRYNVPNDFSKWIDHISYQHGVTVVVAAGYLQHFSEEYLNISPLAYSNNAIVVGAVDVSKDENNNYIFSESLDREGSAYSESNRYFPHVVAPGNIDSVPRFGCVSGDSFSAPLVAGMIAKLIQLRPNISANPTLIKSLVMAGANGEKSEESVDTSGTDMDRKYGAGVINVQKTISCLSEKSFAKTHTGSFASNSTGTQAFYINVPEKAGNIRFALTWNTRSMIADATHNDSSSLLYSSFSFLRLTVTSPSGTVYTSFDTQNPFQLLTFDVGDGEAGLYSVSVSRMGPCSYSLTYSLAAFGCSYVAY